MFNFGKKKDDDQSGLNVIDSEQDGAFDSSSQSLETLTNLGDSLTSDSQEHPFELSGSAPIKTDENDSDFDTNKKAKKKAPLIIGGIGVAVVAGLGYMLFGGSGGSNTPEENNHAKIASDASGALELPTLSSSEPLITEDDDIASNAMSASDVETAISTSQPVQASEAAKPKGDEQVQSKPEETDFIGASTPNVQVKETANKVAENKPATQQQPQQQSLAGKADSGDGVITPPNVPTTQTTQTNVTTGKTGNEIGAATSEQNKSRADELRSEAQKLIDQAAELEKQNDLDALLANKSPEEQVVILRNKLLEQDRALTEVRKSCSGNRNRNSISHSSSTRRRGVSANSNTTRKSIQTASIAEGTVWLRNGSRVSQAYVVGDRLPNGAIIQGIHSDTRTIHTNRGVYKAS